jgi:hypothetical protein
VKRAVRLLLSPIAVALGVTVVAGCGGGGPQAQQPPPLSSLLPKTSHSPAVAPPSPAVIKSAVEAFVDGLNEALRTGDISAAEKASTSKCNCRAELSKITDLYSKHGKFVGLRFVIVRIVPIALAPETSQARVVVRAPQSAVANAKGKQRQVKAKPARPVIFTLTDQGGRWVVSGIADSAGKTATARPSPSR